MNKLYDPVIEKLKANHFYPNVETKLKAKGSEITGLRIDCPPILHTDRENRIIEVLEGHDIIVNWMANNQYIHIKLKV